MAEGHEESDGQGEHQAAALSEEERHGRDPSIPSRAELHAARRGRAARRARRAARRDAPAQGGDEASSDAASSDDVMPAPSTWPQASAAVARTSDPPTRASRAAAARERRRRTRRRSLLVVAALAILAGIVAVVVAVVGRDAVTDPAVADVPDAVPGDPQPALTVVTVAEGPDGPEATGIAILAIERETGEGTVLLVPTTTIADVPGFGAFRLGEAYGFGGAALVGVTVDNLLGIRTDAVATVTDAGWERLVDAAGGVRASVGSPLLDPADDGEVLVPAGEQQLDGAAAAQLLTVRGGGGTELDRLPRAQAVVSGLLHALGADGDAFEAASDAVPEVFDGADEDVVRTVLAELTIARAEGAATTLTLPVSPLGTGTEETFRPDRPRIDALVEERLVASRPDPGVAGERRLQILNGNGEPGVGASVAEVLSPGGYRIVLTGNADRFDYAVTRIVVYDEDEATLAAARDVRDRLGTGEIERSGTPQSVVDLTIVVGTDFPPSD